MAESALFVLLLPVDEALRLNLWILEARYSSYATAR